MNELSPRVTLLDHDPVSQRIVALVERLQQDNGKLRLNDPKELIEELLSEQQLPLTLSVVTTELTHFDAIKADYTKARKAWEKANEKPKLNFN